MHAKQGFGICHSRVLSSKAETECLEQMRTTPRAQESAIAPTLFPKPQAFWKVWKLIGDAKAGGGGSFTSASKTWRFSTFLSLRPLIQFVMLWEPPPLNNYFVATP